jgi:hypothetical protein
VVSEHFPWQKLWEFFFRVDTYFDIFKPQRFVVTRINPWLRDSYTQEHYLFLYNITDDLAKLWYGVLHLDQECWQWWQWRKNSRQGYIAWTQFMVELYERFETDTNYLGHLTKLKQLGTVEDFIVAFECLAFRAEGMTNAFFRECFISGLKEEIRVDVLMAQPSSWVEATKKDKEAQQVVSSQNRKPSFIPRPKPVNPTTPSAPLKIQKLTSVEMVECQLKGLCYNCDDKYFSGHKCKEQKIFMATRGCSNSPSV